jgi:hypothetical protein
VSIQGLDQGLPANDDTHLLPHQIDKFIERRRRVGPQQLNQLESTGLVKGWLAPSAWSSLART